MACSLFYLFSCSSSCIRVASLLHGGLVCSLAPNTVEPRYNEGLRDWKKIVSYDEVSLYRGPFSYILPPVGLKKNSFLYRYIEVR